MKCSFYIKSVIYLLIYIAVLHQLVANEELAGDLRGHQDKAVYIPHVYICSQNEWADTFLASNGYLGIYIHNI